MKEQDWIEFNKRFSAFSQEEEKTLTGIHICSISFFIVIYLLTILKAWGVIW